MRVRAAVPSAVAGLILNAVASAQPASQPASAPASAPATAPATVAASQPSADERSLTVSPAAVPVPALKYQFRFERVEQTPGNGAPEFATALLWQAEDLKRRGEIDDLNFDTPDDAAFVKAMHDKFGQDKAAVPAVAESAARYERVAWDFPVRRDGVGTLLPYLNYARGLANHLATNARLATVAGDYKTAVDLIRIMSVLAAFVDRSDPDTFMVSTLVAVGMQQLTTDQVERLMQRPDAPNLYWALRQLPVPFGNLRAAHLNERSAWGLNYPALEKAWGDELLTPAEWQSTLDGIYKTLSGFHHLDPSLPPEAQYRVGLIADLPAARLDYARRRKLSADAVAALDPIVVVGAYSFDTYRDATDDLTKYALLPYPEALPGVAAASGKLQSLRRQQPTNVFLSLAASLDSALIASARLDRRTAALAAVEAVRAYAAAHDGRLPATLADMTDPPAPPNPATGRPFDYAVEIGAAVLSDPGLHGVRPLRYTVRLRQ